MRRPALAETLYLDFDGFFASVEQQATPRLRGRPIGVVPFANATHTCVIACSKEAKLRGVKNVMSIAEARAVCPEIILVPQSPDLYRRAHNALLSEINSVIPIDAVKSIDELTCRVGHADLQNPAAVGLRIKKRISDNIGSIITCSIGFAANRQLAKMASKTGKPNGNIVWHPNDMPTPLIALTLRDVPGIGKRMCKRLAQIGINSVVDLLATQPKQLRKIWGSVSGERLWYALHGYDVKTPPSSRGMYGHGRVLPPDYRSINNARDASRLLIVKAARRLRRDGCNASRLWLWLNWRNDSLHLGRCLPAVQDDHAVLSALEQLWIEARISLPTDTQILRLGVTLLDLSPANERQLDILLNDDFTHRKWGDLTASLDRLNSKYGRTLVSVGEWTPPPGGYAGGKISYTRIPRAEDFW